ncbi:MAG: class I SAM-dependent methyltransferase, partial [Bacteroidia bacterium]
MKNQYNFVAPFYRLISTIVFGNTILDAQKSLIKKLPQEGNLLVIGGGNGDILPFIFDHAPRLNIMYVEASTTMISLAKKKAGHNPLVHFHHSDDFTYPIFSSDYVLAPFVLDLFSPEKIIEIISKIDNSTGTSPAWYICDFDSQKVQHATIYQKIKIKLTI